MNDDLRDIQCAAIAPGIADGEIKKIQRQRRSIRGGRKLNRFTDRTSGNHTAIIVIISNRDSDGSADSGVCPTRTTVLIEVLITSLPSAKPSWTEVN